MEGFKTISSVQNPRVKNLVRLRDGHHRRRQGRYLIEGERLLARALAAGVPLEEVYVCPEQWVDDEAATALVAELNARQVPVLAMAPAAMAKAAYREHPDGLLAVAPLGDYPLSALKPRLDGLYLVVEHVEKPGNLGTLLRTADAAGVHAIIVTDPVTDLGNPNLLRASQGAVFTQRLAVASNEEAHAWLRAAGVRMVATTPEAAAVYTDLDYTGATALLVGSEERGLSPYWMREAAEVVGARIPMAGSSDSLNVSAATAVFLFEVVRQRRNATGGR